MESSSLPPGIKPPEQCSRPHYPLMLKDYLRYETSSSDGFLEYPRRPRVTTTVRSLLELDLSFAAGPKLDKSHSKATSATISKLQRASAHLLNAVKFIQHKSQYRADDCGNRRPGFLPRSLSRRLSRSMQSKSERSRKQDDNLMIVRVKDIMRWKSFSEANYSPIKTPNYTNATDHNSTWSSSTWSESDDFSIEFGSRCSSNCTTGQSAGDGKKRSLARKERRKEKKAVGGDDQEESHVVTATTYYRKPKGKGEKRVVSSSYEEKEQLSPVSVLDFPDEDADSLSSTSSSAFHHSLANMEMAKKRFLHRIRQFEPVDLDSRLVDSGLDSPATGSDCSFGNGNGAAPEEETARELLARLLMDETQLSKVGEKLMLDFFSEGLEGGEGVEAELVVAAREWTAGGGGEREGRWGVDDMRKSHVKEMEVGGRWRRFDEEEEEVADGVAVALMEELLMDIMC